MIWRLRASGSGAAARPDPGKEVLRGAHPDATHHCPVLSTVLVGIYSGSPDSHESLSLSLPSGRKLWDLSCHGCSPGARKEQRPSHSC